ncbi:2OG-Fe(II) oxygenase [Streptomyces agglomeratus]|uniref:2OG-Fe(II) oxygenase n=1 Tax=Streptomyces agglomeratus TaxID=285458 RepID=UPI000853FC26|nr:2OG-Fe(II) oxygenase [Streptomyces agglomeratus]OEJ36536.1 hypothetical protein BGK72_38220 [Streptomyces agglomeratus]
MSLPSRDVAVLESVLEPALLDALARSMQAAGGHPADVCAPTGRRVDPRVRRTSSVQVPQAVSDRVRLCFEGLRGRLEERFSLPLGGCETPQFLRYERGDRFVPHADVSTSRAHLSPRRRVTAVLHVAQAATAPGTGPVGRRERTMAAHGNLTFFDTSPTVTWQTCRSKVTFPPGSVIAFPSEVVHEVPPVRVGPRLTVVTWFWDA